MRDTTIGNIVKACRFPPLSVKAWLGYRVGILLVLVLLGGGRAYANPNNLEIIFDASGSMNDTLGGQFAERKIDIAKTFLLDFVQKLPTDTSVALRAFGHRGGGCEDIDLLMPLQKKASSALVDAIQGFQPRGATPLSGALESAFQDFQGHEGEHNNIVLISDGQQSPKCPGDPCETVRRLRAQGIDVTVHVVGFDVNQNETAQLECIAETHGGGRYYDAKSEQDFQQAMLDLFPIVSKSWLERLMEATTLVITFGLLAFMVERLTNGIAVALGYWRWWRTRFEVSATADPDLQAHNARTS